MKLEVLSIVNEEGRTVSAVARMLEMPLKEEFVEIRTVYQKIRLGTSMF